MTSVDIAPAIIATGVRKEYFRKGKSQARYFDAVKSCDFGIRAGEFVAITGRSGSGKSTLLNMLSGLLAPTEGSVRFGDIDIYRLDDAALSRLCNESFGIVPQGQTPIYGLTVAQNVELPRTLYRNSADGGAPSIDSLLEIVGIEHLSESSPSELSGGELRRMALARALACGPAVVFADEPTSDLDDENTKLVLDILRDTARKGAAVCMVTHERAASEYADSVYRMTDGILECE